MALSRDQLLDRVWTYLDEPTRKAYTEGEIEDDDLLDIGRSYGWIPQDFSEVEGGSTTVPANPEPSPSIMDQLRPLYDVPQEVMRNVGDAARGGINRSVGAGLFTSGEQAPGVAPEAIRSLIEQFDFEGGGAAGDLLDRIRGTRQTNEELGTELFQQGSQQIQTARGDAGNIVTRGLVDVASSPSSFASVFGGPAAGIGGADVFAQEYTAARLEGLDPESARKRAIGQGAVEAGLSVVPTGKLLGTFGGDAARRFISDRARFAARVGSTSILEGIQEGVTTLAQLGLDSLTAKHADNDDLRAYAEAQLPQDVTKLWQMTQDSIVAGAIGGGGVSAGTSTIQMAAERGKLAGDLLNTVSTQQEADQEIRVARGRIENFISEVEQGSTEVTRQAEIDQAWEQRERERRREENLTSLRTSLQRRFDLAQDQVFELEERINEGDTSRATLTQATQAQRRLEEAQLRLTNFENNFADRPQTTEVPVQEPDITPAPTTVPTVPVPVEAPVPVETPAPKTRKKKTPKQKQEEVVDTQAKLDEFLSKLQPSGTRTLRSESGRTESTGTTVKDVADAIVSKLGRGDTNTAARLITNGNVRLVESLEDIPADTQGVAVGTAGIYDGNQTYVIASQLDPNNVVGEFLTIAAHELKHAGDVSIDPTLRTKMGELIGPEANARINRQIETLAANGNPLAQRAIKAAKKTSDYELELPAYFINESRGERAAAPAVGRVLGNTVSAVRTAAKRIFPGDYEVNLDDVAYLSDQLLKETVIQNPETRAEAPNFLQMIAGQRSTNFDQREKEGLVYKSRDGNLKYWMSDSDSRIAIRPAYSVDLEEDGVVEGVLDEFLKHDTLYKEYPELRNYEVRVEPMDNNALGSFNSITKQIRLNADLFEDGINFDEHFNNRLHRIILHEVQHAIQDIEGFDSGTSPETVLSVDPDYFANQGFINTATANIANLGLKIAQQDAVAVAEELGLRTEQQHQALAAALQNTTRTFSKRSVKDAMDSSYSLGQELIARLRNVPVARTERVATLSETLTEINRAKTENKKLEDAAFAKYQAKLGETEARYTEQNIDMTEDWMEMQPGQSSINPEVNFPETWTGNLLGSNSLSREEKIGDDPKAMNKVTRGAKRLLLPGGGYTPELNEILRHGSNLPASMAARTTQLGNDFLTAMKANAKRLGTTEEAVREDVGKLIEMVDGIEDRDARITAVNAINRKYPGVGTSLNALRDYKLSLTREIIQLRKRDPKPLDEKELAIFNKMMDNAERYTTRAYLATYNQELGELYGKHLLKQAKADPNSEEGKKLSAALEYLSTNELLIPPEEALRAMKIGKIRRVYEAWVGNSTRLTGKNGKEQMIQKLITLPPKTQEQVDAKAMEVVRDLLGQTGNKRTKLVFTPGMQQNRTILESRTDMPQVLRDLLGEITDPYLRETISLQRMINLTTKTKVLTEVFEKGQGEGWYSDTRTDAHTRQLNNVSYGPLDGMWINQDLEDALTGTILSLDNIDASLAELAKEPDAIMQAVMGSTFKLSHQIMGVQKTMQVVASPFNMIANFTGAMGLMAPSQGLINPKVYWDGMRNTARVLGLEITRKNTTEDQIAAAEELLFAGVTDSATMGEFRSEEFEAISKQITKMIDDKTYTPAKMLKVVGKELIGRGEVGNAMRQLYAFMDVWVKVSTYYDRKNFLTEFNKLENTGWSDEDIIRRAGYEAAGTNISYERSVPAVRVLERNIPFFMFLTYFSETFRATGMSYIQAYRDFKMAAQATNPKAKYLAMKQGTLRLVGTTVATAGVQWAVMAALDSEDEEEKKKRQIDAEYMADKWMVPMGLDSDGNEVMLEVQRLDPLGPMNEFFTAVQTAEDKPEAAATAIKDMFVESKGFLSLLQVGTDAAVHAIANATGNNKLLEWDQNRYKNSILERNYPKAYELIRQIGEEYDLGENFVQAIERLWLPTGIMPALDAERTAVAERRPEDFTVRGEPIDEELRAFGYKAYVRDPNMSLLFRKLDYDDEMTRLRQERNDLNERAATMSSEALLDSLNNLLAAEQEAFNDMVSAYEGYEAFDNTSVSQAQDILNNKKLAAQLRSGRFKSTLVDGDALKRWYDNARKEPGADKAALKQEYNLLRKLYREAN